MDSSLRGYWLMTWLGLAGNVLALPLIGWIAFTSPDLRAANLSVAFGLAWPAAVVGIVACAGLIARRRWGVIVAIVALSMALAASLPYGIVRLALISLGADAVRLGALSLVLALLNLLALLYWCRPEHRRQSLRAGLRGSGSLL
ncbi:MAG: hypothetical protein EBZ29_07090 [Synechococcaceae bacterium WB9_4xC_028]|jgi:hypothetical protein|uniref:hypothetical protein n=1 Tax=unclassified Synechococcus TaxID=2626047 RepID=UPI00103C9312|nr:MULTISPECIES: hypothetical protein [unclassified Synechococcus]NDD44496.1 hypothetical protein [Synechococcaceae bacterium WB9_4xB_025]NDD69153.1 hypothetical protein [Synechococcaceae bacterium WB9_4xC_028]QNG26351.1 hypothetical protein H0O21_08700 [Synechococcus sp. HK01-R]TCD59270.1 hypothetical protein CWE17_00205 [Synechococcus sp. BS56D]